MNVKSCLAPDPDSYQIQVVLVENYQSLESTWRALEQEANGSFFNSWTWISCWLDTLPKEVAPLVLEARLKGTVVGVGILVPHLARRHLFFKSQTLCLHHSGRRDLDCVTIEHNNFLLKQGIEKEVLLACFSFMLKQLPSYEEILIAGVGEEDLSLYDQVKQTLPLKLYQQDKQPYFCINLKKLREAQQDYLSALSSNTRYLIKKSLKRASQKGEVKLELAEDLVTAQEFFGALKILHQKYWTGRGLGGAFSHNYFEEFHRALINTCFARGEIQLMRLSVAGEALGYLYNFVRAGHVYCYQSGFNYTDKKLHPGLISHYYAVNHCFSLGLDLYDFLAGDSQYKRSLGPEEHAMYWLAFQKPKFKFLLEKSLRKLKHGLFGPTR